MTDEVNENEPGKPLTSAPEPISQNLVDPMYEVQLKADVIAVIDSYTQSNYLTTTQVIGCLEIVKQWLSFETEDE